MHPYNLRKSIRRSFTPPPSSIDNRPRSPIWLRKSVKFEETTALLLPEQTKSFGVKSIRRSSTLLPSSNDNRPRSPLNLTKSAKKEEETTALLFREKTKSLGVKSTRKSPQPPPPADNRPRSPIMLRNSKTTEVTPPNHRPESRKSLKAKLIRMDKRVGFTPRHTQQHIPSSTITSSVIKAEPSTSQMILNSFRDLLPPDQGNSLISEKNKAFGHETFGIARVKLEPPGSPTYNPPEILPPIVKVPPPVVEKLKPIGDPYKMIDNKRSLVKKDVKTESRSEALYTVTSNSGNPIIQRIHKNRRKSNNIGSLSRMSKTPKADIPATATSLSKVPEPNQSYDNTYGFNKKSKMINTYGKSRNSTTIPKRTMHFTGSLSDRLQLIDTTPTGEDPYQLGEADMREQSPIPKLMLQKTNHGRMKICNDSMGGTGTRRIYDMPDTKAKINRFMSVYEQPKKSQPKKEQPNKEQPKRVQPKKQQPKKDQTKKEQPTKTIIVHEPDLDMIKTEPGIAWPSNMFDQQVNEPSMCDFSYGESAAYLPSLDATEFQELFTSDSALELDHLNQLDDPPEKLVPEKTTKRRMVRTTSLMVPDVKEEVTDSKRGMESRRGRKRAFSTTGLVKPQPPKTQPKPKTARARAGFQIEDQGCDAE